MKFSLAKDHLKRKDYNIKIFYDKIDNYYEIKAYNDTNMEVANLTFKTIYSPERHIWLYNVVTNENYKNQGYATALLKVLEYVAYVYKIDVVEGKYYPTDKNANIFYENNGYKIYREYYDTFLYKKIDFKEVLSDIKPYICDFEITETNFDKEK